MKRLGLVLSSCSVAAVSILFVPSAAAAQTYTLNVASSWEKTHVNNTAYLHLIDTVNAKAKTADGNIVMKWVGGPETFKAQDLPDATRAGSIDWFYASNLYYTGVVPQSSYTTLPYAWSFDNASEMWHSKIGELSDRAWEKKKGLRVMDFASLLSFYFFTKEPFTQLSDFQGKKLRVPGGLFSYIPQYMGAVSTKLASAETYGAIERGTINGAFQPLASYIQYSYWDVAPYLLNTPFTIAGAWYWANAKKIDSLPKSLQNKLAEILKEEEKFCIQFWRSKQDAWLADVKKHNVKLVNFSKEDSKKLQNSISRLKDKLAEQVPADEAKEVFAVYDKFAGQ